MTTFSVLTLYTRNNVLHCEPISIQNSLSHVKKLRSSKFGKIAAFSRKKIATLLYVMRMPVLCSIISYVIFLYSIVDDKLSFLRNKKNTWTLNNQRKKNIRRSDLVFHMVKSIQWYAEFFCYCSSQPTKSLGQLELAFFAYMQNIACDITITIIIIN